MADGRTEFDHQAFKKRVRSMGLKMSWIAGEVGVTPNAMYAWANGRRTPPKPVQILLTQILSQGKAS